MSVNALCVLLTVYVWMCVCTRVHAHWYLLMDAVPRFNEVAWMAQRMLAQ